MDGMTADEIIRLIEQSGRKGRAFLEQADMPDRTATLCAALANAELSHVRHVICNIMATLRDPLALPCLLDALSDTDRKVVAAAADAVGNCAHHNPVPPLLADALGQRLLTILGDPGQEVFVRTAVIYALGLMRYSAAFPILVNALEDETPSVRWSAAEALAHIGNPEARPALESRLQRETDDIVRRYLQKALASL
jgi:HEAT repeat protein